MNDNQRVFVLRKSIIEDWKYRGLTWQEITRKYKVSKAWFYRLRKRYIEFGEKRLDNLVRKKGFFLTWVED